MSKVESLEQLLDSARIKTSCDLDLLLFLARHPDALMTTEALAAMVGYDLQEIAKSLDLLIERQLLERPQKPTHTTRLYRFRAAHGAPALHQILEIAATSEGRRRMRQILRQRQSQTSTAASPQQSDIVNVSDIKGKAHG